MFYFRPLTETIDTILPMPDVDRISDLPQGLHAQLNAATGERTDASLLRRFFNWLLHRSMMRRSRLALFEMTDEQLRDIGLKRSEAEREARKVRFHLR
ncbi:DUF1127 domain-containing protein [Ochrobactrum sp. Q0168]|uniref:DUF1127 domain-containing protein n=1 Tax=Ochrobactrum sp. Q0168 TaxID=2793241 RepID=UPI0018EB38B9|nr:DUF1127 domain-containing protein [Ochrobactrum sp. Q0168]